MLSFKERHEASLNDLHVQPACLTTTVESSGSRTRESVLMPFREFLKRVFIQGI